ncbi:MAG: alpha/beta fold hydrolase [Thermoleophilia bacterium]|nr:alpha/beta fold hydrolase [Thermoleophilia bacterium]
MRLLEMKTGRHAAYVTACALACLVAVLVAVSAAGCGEDTATATSPATAVGNGSRIVAFATDDGVTLGGHLFGSGSAGVVLAHMYPADQTSWFSAAERLAQAGYLVLTFDFRGYGESEGSKDIDQLARDVSAAIKALNVAGATEAVLIGASMGGTACLIAAESNNLRRAVSSQFPAPGIPVTGVVTLSTPVEFKGLSAEEAAPGLQIPLRFIAAEDDAGAAGALRLQELSGGKGEPHIVPGDDHGTDLLKGEAADQVWDLLAVFLNDNLDPAER